MDESLFVLLLLSGFFWISSSLSRQYHYINLRMSWPEAQSYCREKFTDLATVDTMDDVNGLINIINNGYSGSVWIGLTRATEKCWGWSKREDKLTQHSAWKITHPNDEGECGYFPFGFWHSYPCSSFLHFVCYSESIGLIRVQKLKNWTEAQSYCRERYTDLATIRNSEEHNQLKSIIPSGSWIWTGLYQDPWGWTDKCSHSFRHWEAGQPSQNAGSGDCVAMSRNNSGKWFLENCVLQFPFICHGGKVIRKQIIRLELSCNEKCGLYNHSLQTTILNKVIEKLKIMGLVSDSKIQWRKKEGEDIFQKKKGK